MTSGRDRGGPARQSLGRVEGVARGGEPLRMDPPQAPVTVGEVVRVAEEDYRYGRGELILRVTEVLDVQHRRDGPWLNLRGVELRRDGSQFQPQPRLALVRLNALRTRPRLASEQGMTATYLASAVLQQLDHAQTELDRHLATRADGRCMACLQPEPCPTRMTANATLVRYGRLPRRRPGLAHVEVGRVESGDPPRFGWFTDAAARR